MKSYEQEKDEVQSVKYCINKLITKIYRQHTCTYLRTLCIRQSIYTKNQTRIAHSFKLLYFNKKHNEEANRYQKTQEKDCQKKEQQNNCCTSTSNSDRSVKHFFII